MAARRRGTSGATLALVWDFDSAAGQVNASFPYHFRRSPLEEELEAVGILRELTQRSFVLLELAGARLHVLHWHAASAEAAAAVMGRVAFLAQGYGVRYVEAMAIDAVEQAQLTALGFRARRTPTDLWCYPADALGEAPFAVQGYDTDQNL